MISSLHEVELRKYADHHRISSGIQRAICLAANFLPRQVFGDDSPLDRRAARSGSDCVWIGSSGALAIGSIPHFLLIFFSNSDGQAVSMRK
jgi:hypothetical protein